jgi:hypothetical protein
MTTLESIPDGTAFNDTTFNINTKIQTISNVSFINCNFILSINACVNLNNCTIKNCKIQSIGELEELQFRCPIFNISDSDTIENINVIGFFKTFSIQKSNCRWLRDTSTSNSIHYTSSTIQSFIIKGKCNKLNINNTIFSSTFNKNGFWNKEIRISGECENTIFDHVRVNPFFLSTKCKSKESIDLSSAIIIDNWSMLRKKYSGLSLVIVFLLTFLYVLPLITRSFFLIMASKVDPISFQGSKIPLWESLIFGGNDGLMAVLYASLTMILLFYNFGRIWMTLSISKIREEEKFLNDCKFQLVSVNPEKYQMELKIDKLLAVLFWFSLIYSVIRLIETLFINVPFGLVY